MVGKDPHTPPYDPFHWPTFLGSRLKTGNFCSKVSFLLKTVFSVISACFATFLAEGGFPREFHDSRPSRIIPNVYGVSWRRNMRVLSKSGPKVVISAPKVVISGHFWPFSARFSPVLDKKHTCFLRNTVQGRLTLISVAHLPTPFLATFRYFSLLSAPFLSRLFSTPVPGRLILQNPAERCPRRDRKVEKRSSKRG